jgi:hypothetical protein
MKHLLRPRTAISVAHLSHGVALLVVATIVRESVLGPSVNGSGQECPLYIGTLQYGSELCYTVAGLEWGIDGGPTIYLVAEILALADHLGGSSDGAADWPDAAFFGVV